MNARTRRKFEQPTGAVAINITVPAALVPRLGEILTKYGFNGPADYFQSRIRLDSGLVLNNSNNVQTGN